MKLKQISILIENSPGRLYEVTRALGEAGINLRALNLVDTGDFGKLRLLVSDIATTRQIVMKHHWPARVDEVVAVEIEDKPGYLASMLEPLKDNGLNVVHMVSGLPTDGRTLYIRLWYQVGGFWQFVDQQVIAATLAAPMVMSPIAGSTLGDANVTFQWTANEQPVTNWWFFIGSSTGGRDIYNSGDLGTNLSQHVTGLPTDGRTLHARLWYRSGGAWRFVDVQYTASNE